MIERTFGVWKNKCRILRQMPSYDIEDQRNIVVATCVLHNFIRIHDRKMRDLSGMNWEAMLMNEVSIVVVKKTWRIYITRR